MIQSTFWIGATVHLSEYRPHRNCPSIAILRQEKQNCVLHLGQNIFLEPYANSIKIVHPGQTRMDGTPFKLQNCSSVKRALSKTSWIHFNRFLQLWSEVHSDLQLQQKLKTFLFFFVHTMHFVCSRDNSWRWQKLPHDGQVDDSTLPWYIKLRDILNSKKHISSAVMSAFLAISCTSHTLLHIKHRISGLSLYRSVCFMWQNRLSAAKKEPKKDVLFATDLSQWALMLRN